MGVLGIDLRDGLEVGVGLLAFPAVEMPDAQAEVGVGIAGIACEDVPENLGGPAEFFRLELGIGIAAIEQGNAQVDPSSQPIGRPPDRFLEGLDGLVRSRTALILLVEPFQKRQTTGIGLGRREKVRLRGFRLPRPKTPEQVAAGGKSEQQYAAPPKPPAQVAGPNRMFHGLYAWSLKDSVSRV